jgi:hypothetical protein
LCPFADKRPTDPQANSGAMPRVQQVGGVADRGGQVVAQLLDPRLGNSAGLAPDAVLRRLGQHAPTRALHVDSRHSVMLWRRCCSIRPSASRGSRAGRTRRVVHELSGSPRCAAIIDFDAPGWSGLRRWSSARSVAASSRSAEGVVSSVLNPALCELGAAAEALIWPGQPEQPVGSLLRTSETTLAGSSSVVRALLA